MPVGVRNLRRGRSRKMDTGEEIIRMRQAERKKGCEHPEKLRGKPEECTQEQIRECHGGVKEHLCVSGEVALQHHRPIQFK